MPVTTHAGTPRTGPVLLPARLGIVIDGSHSQLTSTFEFLVQGERDLLHQFRCEPPPKRRGLFQREPRPHSLPETAQVAGQPENCPACEAGKTAVAANARQIVVILGTREGQDSYRQHDGLCRPHAWLVLREAPEETADWLATETERRLESLLGEFELYFHRLDYRFHHEPKGEEQIAWQRALRFFWGDVLVDQ